MELKTVTHHLDVLAENDLVRHSGNGYGAVDLPTDRVWNHWDVVEAIITELE